MHLPTAITLQFVSAFPISREPSHLSAIMNHHASASSRARELLMHQGLPHCTPPGCAIAQHQQATDLVKQIMLDLALSLVHRPLAKPAAILSRKERRWMQNCLFPQPLKGLGSRMDGTGTLLDLLHQQRPLVVDIILLEVPCLPAASSMMKVRSHRCLSCQCGTTSHRTPALQEPCSSCLRPPQMHSRPLPILTNAEALQQVTPEASTL